MILIDTNVLTRVARASDPQGIVARGAIHRLMALSERLVIVPQNLYEFWVVATRAVGGPPSGQNGLGMSISQAGAWLRFMRRRFPLLPDRAEMNERWQSLVESVGITGFRAHDARLVAAMQCYGIERILTFNLKDFARLPVVAIDPATV